MRLDQCLFGYEDGHRLLASSMPLGSAAASLTELSDLAPGAVFGKSDGYWTGLPVPGIGRYALMRTWPAPEMSRPGCVWTHALLIEPTLLEDLVDLAALQPMVFRPQGPRDRDRYARPARLAVGYERGRSRDPATEQLVPAVLRLLYGGGPGGPVRLDGPGDLDDALFAVWSQQWPRLRRNFRFQTAASREVRSSGATRFDVSATLAGSGSVADEPPQDAEGRWLRATAADAHSRTGGPVRLFLWRYGGDVRRQRHSFRPLVEIKLMHDGAPPDAGAKLLGIVTRSFPEAEDATRLKQEIVDGEVVPSAQLDVLWYVLAHRGDAVFPAPSDAGVGRLALVWPERPDDLLHLAERTADAKDPLGASVFAAVAGAVPTDSFWSLTGSFPRVRDRMVEARPDLLAAEGALDLDNATLARLLRLVPADTPVVGLIVPRLLSRDDEKLASVAFERDPRDVAAQVVSAADRREVKVGHAWLRELVRRPSVLLDPEIMGRIDRTSLLYEFGEALNWLTPAVVEAGPEPWIAALLDVTKDLPGDRRDALGTFLVALALAAGGDGGRRLLEEFFDMVHGQELKSRLPWRARDILLPLLPEVGWGRGWDYGLRLRMAVATAYVENGYPPESYAALAGSRRVRAMLADAAAATPGGDPYARAAST